MTDQFNQLTPAEAERLAYLLEELGEAQQAIGKILRHGYEFRNPDNEAHINNRFDLERELADIMSAVDLMHRNGDIDAHWIDELRKDKTYRYMHHQEFE